MNLLNNFPFEFVFSLPPKINSYRLSIEIHSEEPLESSIESADEFIRLFCQSVGEQFYNRSNEIGRLDIDHFVFDKVNQTYRYQLNAENVEAFSYSVLLSLLFQATLLEEPISKVVVAADIPSSIFISPENLLESILGNDLLQENLPYHVEWSDPDSISSGFDVLIEFTNAIDDQVFEKFEQGVILLDNILFMYGFRFDFDDQEVFFPSPGSLTRISPTTVTYYTDFKEDTHVYFFLFNFLSAFHKNVNPIQLVEIE